MKAFRLKKHRMNNVKLNVFVVQQDEDSIVPPGCKYDLPSPPPLDKPRLPRKLLTKVTKPGYDGRVEMTFDGVM